MRPTYSVRYAVPPPHLLACTRHEGNVSQVRVLLADEHPLFRAGIRAALEGDGFRICAEADTAPAAVEAALRERPDLCLVDVDLPEGGGIGAAERICAAVPDTRVVLLTPTGDGDRLLDALRAGA